MTEANPFFHRGPIRDPVYFYNRQRETDRSLSLLRNAQSVSIVGPRRIGKTSLLFHLMDTDVLKQHDLSLERFCFVYVDCESWSHLEPGDFYALLLEELRDALATAGHQIKLIAPVASSLTYRVFERAIQTVSRQEIQLIFLLDEFEALSANPYLDVDFFSGLRGLSTRHRISYVTASVKPLLTLTYAQTSALSSPFFNFFAQLRLKLFSVVEAEKMLADLASKGGVTLTPPTLDFLLRLAGPHPFFLQIAGDYAFELSVAKGAPLDEADCDLVRRRFLAEAENQWVYYWHNLSSDEQKYLALLPIAQQSKTNVLRRMEEAGLVWQRDGTFMPLSEAFQTFVNRRTVPGLLQVPPVTLDPDHRVALLRGHPVSLPRVEYDLLVCLVTCAGQIISHKELEACVWPDQYIEDPERLRTAIKSLRRALGNDADCIQNVRGVGYMFVGS